MKNLLFILLLLPSFHLHAQWIDFDDSTYKSRVFIDTVNYKHNTWQVGKPVKTTFTSAHGGLRAMVTDTAHPYQAHDTSVFIVKALMSLSPAGHGAMPFIFSLSFWHQLDLDSNSVASIEISGDTGHTWRNILKDTTGVFVGWPDSGGKPSFDTSTHGWKWFSTVFMALHGSLTADTTLFRFTFLSGTNDSNKDGWIIDDLEIQHYSEGAVTQVNGNNDIRIFPNPGQSLLTIASATDKITSVAITDLAGKTVYSHEFSSNEVAVEVADLPKGMYLIKINDTEVRKFLKE